MPEIVLKIIVCFFAGMFAGVGTGFVGMSAAVAITPLLMGFLGVEHYPATAIALASDVLASAIAAIMYKRHKNVNLKGCWILVLCVLVATFVGTAAAYFIPSELMGYGTIATIFFMSLKLLFFPSKKKPDDLKVVHKHRRIVYQIVFGLLIGFVCGFVGAGGGMMLLLVLTVFLGYEMHQAVGTSVCIMTVSALFGSVFHIAFDGMMNKAPIQPENIDYVILGLCVVFTFVFSLLGSKFANKMNEKHLNLVSGLMLLGIATTVFIVETIGTFGTFNIIKYVVVILLNVFGLFTVIKLRSHKHGKEKQK